MNRMSQSSESTMVLTEQPTLTEDERFAFIQEEETWICDLCQSKAEKLNPYNEGGCVMDYRELVNGPSWESLCEAAQVDQGYGHLERDDQPNDPEHGGFENDIFAIRPYDWSEPDEFLPNFEHKPSGFKLWWYKYAFRGATMNYDLSAEELARLFRLCALHIGGAVRSQRQPITVNELIEHLQTRFKGHEKVLAKDSSCPGERLVLTHFEKVQNEETRCDEVHLYFDEMDESE